MTHLVVQESVVLSKCRILHDMTFGLNCRTIKAYFNVKCDFVCTMKIYEYERIFLLEKYAHNTTKHIVKICIHIVP